jgi:hypothetical protein
MNDDEYDNWWDHTPSPSAESPSPTVTPAPWPAPYPSGRRNYVIRNGKAIRLPADPERTWLLRPDRPSWHPDTCAASCCWTRDRPPPA